MSTHRSSVIMDIFILLYVVIDVVSAIFTQADCPYQPVDAFVDGACYWKSDATDKGTFLDGRKKCREQGGDLAVLPSQQAIDGLFPDTASQYYFVNLFDGYPGDESAGLPRAWISTTVVVQPFIKWRTSDNQPDGYANGLGNNPVQDCVITRAADKSYSDKACMFKGDWSTMTFPYACSYDPLEPTHSCITNGDCLSDHYVAVQHQYMEGVDINNKTGYGIEDHGTVSVSSQIECAVTCHMTPGCENIKWNPRLEKCQMLGHLTFTLHPYTDTDWMMLTRYRFYDPTA